MRDLFLNMTTSLDGYIAGPNGELDWMTTTPDPDLTADTVAQLRTADAGFIGYPTAEAMTRYWTHIARDQQASPAARDIANAVAGMHTYAVSNKPEQLDVPNAEVLVAPDDETLTAAVTTIKQRPGRDLGLPGGVRTAQTIRPPRPHRPVRTPHRTDHPRRRAAAVHRTGLLDADRGQGLPMRRHTPHLPPGRQRPARTGRARGTLIVRR